jgi:hypothetical protein
MPSKTPLNLFPPEDAITSRSILKKPVHGLRNILATWRDSSRETAYSMSAAGWGRLPSPLRVIFDSTARYEGIDVVSSGIA